MNFDWQRITVGSVLSEFGGNLRTGPFGTSLKAEEYTESGTPVIAVRDIGRGYIRIDERTPRVPLKVVQRLEIYKVVEGDILFGRKGAVENVAIVTATEDGWLMGSDCIRLRLPKTIDPLFVAYAFQSPSHRAWMVQHATGSTMASLNQRIIELIPLYLPPLPEQRTIAHILGTLDDKIELNRQMNQTLEGIARALFQSWFVDFEPVWAKVEGRPTGLAPEIEALFPNRFVDTEMGPVPEGWEVKPLDQIANYQNGLALQKYPPKNERDFLPVIKIRELRQGKADDNSDKASLEIKSECIIDDGDVIFSWSGSLLVSIWCGGKGALNQHLFKVTSDRYPRWFYYLWTQYHLGEFQRIAADKATTMGHIKRSHLSDALVVVPPMQLISTASTMIEPFVERYVSNEVESRSLTELRDTLLPKLISGELRVQSF